jgi:hypothetical protein
MANDEVVLSMLVQLQCPITAALVEVDQMILFAKVFRMRISRLSRCPPRATILSSG